MPTAPAAAAVRNSLQFAVGVNPEQEAQSRHLARFTGIPIDTVRAKPDAARGAAALLATDADRLAADNAVTARALADPSTARMLHGDIPNTVATENAARALGAAGPQRSIWEDIPSGLAATADKIHLAAIRAQFALSDYLPGFLKPGDEAAETAGAVQQAAQAEAPTTLPGQIAAGLSYAGAGVLAPAVVAGAEGVAREQELLNEGADPDAARLAAGAEGGLQGLIQMLPLGRILFRQGGAQLVKSGAAAVAKAGAAGAAQTYASDELTRDLLQGVGQDELGAKYAPTVEKTLAGAAFNAALHVGTQTVHGLASGATPADIQFQAKRAAAQQQALQELGTASAAGKFRELDQQAFRQFVDDAATAGGAPDLFVDGRKLAEVLDQSGISGEQLQQQLPEVADQMREALQSEGMVRIPVADYAAHIAGGPADAALLPHFRTDSEGPTFEEAQKLQAEHAAQMTADAAAPPAPDEAAAAFKASGDAVEKAAREQLDAANRFPKEVNAQYAGLVRAYYEATAQRSGVTPEELFQAFPLAVEDHGLGALQQNGEVMPERPPRASYDPETGTVHLLKDADLSSFLHELGHHFLETHARLALDEKAPAGLRADVESLVGDPAAWLARTLGERTDVHENFARSFEAYLMEGQAPAAPLRSLFARFRSWLVQVYRTVAPLRVNLTDDVRAVMDRMLASEDAIREQEAVRGMTALFETKPEGMNDAEFAAYRAQGEQATQEAVDKLQDAAVRDMRWLSNAKDRAVRDIQREAAAARAQIREEVEREVDATPAFAAKKFIAEQRKALPAAERDAMPLDGIAQQFKFSSSDEMLRAIAEAGNRADIVRAMTDQRMLEQHGELTDPGAIQRFAEAAIHTQARARIIATELRALARATGSPALLARAAREAADSSIAAKRVRDLRPDQYTAAEGRAGRAADKAFKEGDVEAAAVQKRAQLLSNALAHAAIEARGEITKGVQYLKKFAKASIRANLAPEFLGQIDALLERYDLRQATGAALDKRASLRSYVQSRLNAGEMPIPVAAESLLSPAERAAFEAKITERGPDGELVYPEPDEHVKLLAEALDRSARTPYQQLTVEAFRGLRDTVKSIEHLARQQNKLLTAEGHRTYQEIRDEIGTSIDAHATASGKGDRSAATVLGRALQGVRAFGAAHIKVATWARIMDGGKDDGPVWRYLVMPANKAASFETGRRAEATKALSEIWRPLLKEVPFSERAGGGRFFPELGTSLNWQERMAIALNYGNEGNLQRLLGGGIAAKHDRLTMPQVQAVLKTLKAAEWHAVQATWDHLETYRPEVGALERRMSGAEPAWVEPRPFKATTADGQTIALRGGYYPIMYDPRGSLKAQQHADAQDAKAMMKAAYSQAATQHGFTKNRVEEVNGRPLMLRWDSLYRGVNDVIHDLAWREWVRDANKLLRSKTIDTAIRDHYGPEVKREIEKWRDDIVAGTKRLDSKVETAAGVLRQGISASGLTFNIMSAAMQPLGLTQSIVRVGFSPMARGLAKYIGSPIDATREANAKSDWMANRMRTRFRELNELRNTVQGQTAPKELLGRYGYWLMMRAQQMVDVPTWHGAYEKAVADGHADDRAVQLADQAVKDAQGGGEEVDQAGVERGGPLVKLFTTFYGFMNTAANMGYMSLKSDRAAATKAAHLLLLYTVPAVLGALVKDALTPGDSNNWDEDHIAKKLAQEQASFLLGLVVFGREFSGLVSGQDYSGPAGLRLIPDTAKLVTQAKQGEFDDAFRKTFVNEMGDLFGLPGAQINRTITGAEALASDQTDNPFALAFGYQQPR